MQEIVQEQSFIKGFYLVKALSYGATSIVYRIKRKRNFKKIKFQQDHQKYKEIQIEYYRKVQNKMQNKQKDLIYRFQNYQINTDKNNIKGIQIQGKDQSNQDQIFTFKEYNLKKIHYSSNQEIKKTIRYNILTELILYSKLNQQGITKAHKIYIEYKTTKGQKNNQLSLQMQKLGLILESNSKGNISALINYIDRTKILKDSKLKIIKFYVAQIVNSLSYLNEKMNILHRDIKAENIMINKKFQLKIIDFGTAYFKQDFLQRIDQNQFRLLKSLVFQQKEENNEKYSKKQLFEDYLKNKQKQKTLVGSKHYISPQMIQNTKNQMFFIDKAYQKTDIWSFGVLLYKIFHDKFPFQHKNQKALLQIIQNQQINCQIDKSLPQQVKQLLEKVLKKDYTQRATWSQIKQLPFFQGLNVEKIYQYDSPIYQLLEQQKKILRQNYQKYQSIHFEQNMLVQTKESKKVRKVLIVTSINQPTLTKVDKIIILKINNTVSEQLILEELKVFQQNKILVLNFQTKDLTYKFQAIKTVQKDSISKEITQKFTQQRVIQKMTSVINKLISKTKMKPDDFLY